MEKEFLINKPSISPELLEVFGLNGRSLNKEKLENIISQFKNGQERFDSDPYFNKTVMCIYYDYNTIDLISDILDVINNQKETIEELTKRRF